MRALGLVVTHGALLIITSGFCMAQVSANATTPPAQPTTLPVTTQIKKTIVFLDTFCLHDFSQQLAPLTQSGFLQMSPQQEVATVQQLMALTSKLQGVGQSIAKLNAEDIAYLKQNVPIDTSSAAAVATEGVWRASILLKMMSLSTQDLSELTPKDLTLIPLDEHMGTGFLMRFRDGRVDASGNDKNAGFLYLVTNRHVAQPGSEEDKPCTIVGSTIMLNRRPDKDHPTLYAETDRFEKFARWVFPEDRSVDLAVTPIGLPFSVYDYLTVGDEQFTTDEDLQQKYVVEGDPVLFSGLFIQSFTEVHTLEPIIRFGPLAMLPEGTVKTTMNGRIGHLYFAEAHAFGGNSDSPMFIDINKYRNVIGNPNYKFLGVISGEVLESADMTLNITTTVAGNVKANSDVSTVVPAAELMKVLKGPQLAAIRLEELQRLAKAKPKT